MGDNPRSIIVGVGTVFPLDPPSKLVRADERGDAAKWNALESLGTTRLKPQITKWTGAYSPPGIMTRWASSTIIPFPSSISIPMPAITISRRTSSAAIPASAAVPASAAFLSPVIRSRSSAPLSTATAITVTAWRVVPVIRIVCVISAGMFILWVETWVEISATVVRHVCSPTVSLPSLQSQDRAHPGRYEAEQPGKLMEAEQSGKSTELNGAILSITAVVGLASTLGLLANDFIFDTHGVDVVITKLLSSSPWSYWVFSRFHSVVWFDNCCSILTMVSAVASFSLYDCICLFLCPFICPPIYLRVFALFLLHWLNISSRGWIAANWIWKPFSGPVVLLHTSTYIFVVSGLPSALKPSDYCHRSGMSVFFVCHDCRHRDCAAAGNYWLVLFLQHVNTRGVQTLFNLIRTI